MNQQEQAPASYRMIGGHLFSRLWSSLTCCRSSFMSSKSGLILSKTSCHVQVIQCDQDVQLAPVQVGSCDLDRYQITWFMANEFFLAGFRTALPLVGWSPRFLTTPAVSSSDSSSSGACKAPSRPSNAPSEPIGEAKLFRQNSLQLNGYQTFCTNVHEWFLSWHKSANINMRMVAYLDLRKSSSNQS